MNLWFIELLDAAKNLACSLCKEENLVKTEFHLLRCVYLMKDKYLKEEMCQIKYTDVFGDIQKQAKTANVFRKIMNIYEK